MIYKTEFIYEWKGRLTPSSKTMCLILKAVIILLLNFYTCSAFFKTQTLVDLNAFKVRHSTKQFLTAHIHVVGKRSGAEQFISDGIFEYEKRLSVTMTVNTYFYKSDEELIKGVSEQKYKLFCLDENGMEYTSREFSKLMYRALENGGAHVGFVIGGFAGLPPELRSSAYSLISLSRMTWTHQMARLLLVEQIYRATEIAKGSKYHKD